MLAQMSEPMFIVSVIAVVIGFIVLARAVFVLLYSLMVISKTDRFYTEIQKHIDTNGDLPNNNELDNILKACKLQKRID